MHTNHVDGSALVPNLDKFAPGVAHEYFYWVGVLPKFPKESVALAGVNFPKMNELLIPDPTKASGKSRIPVIGAIVTLDRAKFERMLDRLPRTVIRFLEEKEVAEESGTGKNLGDVHTRARKGHVLTIPSAAEVEALKARGKSPRHYVQRPMDEPAARYMFAVLCENQEKPERRDTYPEVLEHTGLVWPEDETEAESDERNTDRSGDPDPMAERGSDPGADALLC